MVAIMGRMFQNGTSGATGPEMWPLGGAFENGRLLVIAITGRMFQNGTFGTTVPEMLQPGAPFEPGVPSPLPRATSSEVKPRLRGQVLRAGRRHCRGLRQGRSCYA